MRHSNETENRDVKIPSLETRSLASSLFADWVASSVRQFAESQSVCRDAAVAPESVAWASAVSLARGSHEPVGDC